MKRFVVGTALLLPLGAMALPAGAIAEQASQPSSPAAGQLDAGAEHTCLLADGAVRCWGSGTSGRLGYGNTNNIGDDETPGAAAPVDLGPDRTATAISAGDAHTCAILDDGSVRCWGFGADGRLGYGNTNDIGDNETPGSAGAVNIGIGRRATAISAGSAHTCVVLNTGRVLCWGFGGDLPDRRGDGRLGYGDMVSVGDDEEPGTRAPVDTGENVTAISAGGSHTCALLVDAKVRCWGTNGFFSNQSDGRLGTGDPRVITIGDDEPPTAVEPISLGAPATAISAGDFHGCAVLEGGAVRCWGNGLGGRLGYGNESSIGNDEPPSMAGPVDLGGSAAAITAGGHSCARLTNGEARCWGPGSFGRLGYGNTANLGDNETSLLMPVDLAGTPTAISAGASHTCALLGAATVRCWGEADFGRLGYGNVIDIGDDETPSAAGPVDFRPVASIGDTTLTEGSSGEATVTFTVNLSSASGQTASVAYATADEGAVAPADYTAQSGTLTFAPGETSKTITVSVKGDTLDEPDERFLVGLSAPTNLVVTDAQATGTILDDDAPAGNPVIPVDPDAAARRAQAARLRGLRTCLAKIRRRGPRAGRARRACLRRWGRTPGAVKGLKARALSKTKIVITFRAAGTHGSRPPAARDYLIKQSNRPIRGARGFRRAFSLCKGSCRVSTITRVGAKITLKVTDLRPRTAYYYSVAARDNVSDRLGPRSRVVRARTR